MPLEHRKHYPVLVIGTGIAGLTVAFSLARAGVAVLLVTKAADPSDCNTFWAQGGIIYEGHQDSPARLVEDILQAGAGLCNAESVRFLAVEGPKAVRGILLDELHVPFSKDREGELDLTQEGAHSVSRIIHAGDSTGRAIEISLLNQVSKEPNITLATELTAVDLLTTHHHPLDVQVRYRLDNECIGAYLLDNRTNEVFTVFADFTVLATGGVGQIYLHTTNTRHTIGDGVVMAHRAGARIMNAEYVQFHPTALAQKRTNHFLISEALRGEGARLKNQDGESFMERYEPTLRDLAPRDVVTRAIVEEMTTRKEEFVYLDLANFYHGDEPILQRFPTIAQECREIGIDIEKEPIPVVPAAHYFCGGVLVNNFGETTLHRLYAIGETSCTGVHGANRLASTSLLEGLTWGYFAAALHPRKAARAELARPRERAGGHARPPRSLLARRRSRRPRRVDPRRRPRLAPAGQRQQGGPRAHPPGLDDDPEHDVELRRDRADVRAPRARRRGHARAGEPPHALLPRVDDQPRDRRALPRPEHRLDHRECRDPEPRVPRRPLHQVGAACGRPDPDRGLRPPGS